MDAVRRSVPTGAPRLPPGVIERPRLVSALEGPEPLVAIRSAGGTGKTTLLAQWALRYRGTSVWLTADDGTRSRSGYWMRLLTQLEAAGVITPLVLERELSSLASDGTATVDALVRALSTSREPVTFVLDNVGAWETPTFWDDVCRDVVEILARVPALRCLVAGRFPTPLESPGLRAVIDVRVIDAEEMLLTRDEIREIVERHGAGLDREGRRRVCEMESASQAMTLRYTLEMLRQSPEHARALGRSGTQLPHLDIVRQDVLGKVRDAATLDFLGATCLAPMVDVALAERLTGRSDSREMLDSLEAAGAGQWSRADDGTGVFRYGEYLRAAASDEYARRHPERLARLHVLIARWLFDVHGEKLGALEHSVRGRDLEFASHVLLRTYPMSDEDRDHVGRLLNDLPAHQIHRHPLLALRYALILNSRESTQARALEYFVSSSAVGRLRAASSPDGERAIHVGIESAVWRLLGQEGRMRKRADDAVTAMQHTLRAEDRDPSLEWVSLQTLHHAGISLIYAGAYDRARDAFSLLAEVAERRSRAGFENAAWSGIAIIAVLRGEFDGAQRALARIDPTGWPKPWAEGYMASLGHIAQAWVHLNAGHPGRALTTLEVLAPHASTIEHWDLLLGARVLAECMEGRVDEALLLFDTVRSSRTTKRTFDSSRDRLSIIDAMVSYAAGTPRPVRRATLRRRLAPLAHAVEAITSDQRGDTASAHAHLAAAETAAHKPLAHAFAAVAGARLGAREGSTLPAERYAGRLQALVREHDLRWPLALLQQTARDRLVSAEVDDGNVAALSPALAAMPAIVPAHAGSTTVPRLTPRERELLEAMRFIDSRSELATHLFVSINTVKTQLRSLYSKLGVSTREEALEAALIHGLIERDSAEEG